MSCLQGKVVRMHVESQGLLGDSTRVLQAEPSKLDIKRRKPGIHFINLPIGRDL